MGNSFGRKPQNITKKNNKIKSKYCSLALPKTTKYKFIFNVCLMHCQVILPEVQELMLMFA